MATAYRSSQSVTNGTAGTSVTVTKPSGIVDTGTDPDRDQLIAFIAATGIPSFTEPAGWTLVASAVDAGNAVTLKAYRKLASSEGASWTWTLGSSQRNWGWVGAYTGVDPDDVVADFDTDLTLTTSTTLGALLTNFPADGQAIAAGAAVRTASGAATTWTHTGTERADLSTNAGAGTDIAGVVGDSVNSTGASASYVASVVASQNQTAGAFIALTLNPYFVPYGGGVGETGVVLEAAFGVDPDSDSADWDWTDLTSFVHHPAKLVLTHGRANRTSQADPSSMTFTLLNLNGEFTYPTGAYTDQMVLNLPFRARLTGFGTNALGDGFHRGTTFLASMRPRWDTSARFAVVDIVAQGRLRREQQREDVLKSAAYTAIQRMVSTAGFASPIVHWPFEDESGATTAASAVPGLAAVSAPSVTFGTDTSIAGAAPLAQFDATSSPFFAPVPPYVDTGTWTAMFCMTVPTEPAANIHLMDVFTTGTANQWRLVLAPGSPSQFTVQVFAPGGSVLFNSGVDLDESTFYGQGRFYTFTVTQSGADVSFVAIVWSGSSGTGKSGTVSGQTAGIVTGFVPAFIGGLDGAGFGHLALHVEPGADGTFSSTSVVDGNAGDWPWARFQKLCQQQNVPYIMDQSESTDLTMGPQGVATFMSLVREAELVEGCVLNDSGEFAGATGLLWFPARDDRDNIDATMTLDMSSGQIAPGFEPILDDQDIVNDFEASRPDGSSARVKDENSIARGHYRQGLTFNIEDDSMLLHLAGWRVNLGTVTGMRFPSVGWNMRRTPDLAEQWLACRLFNRIDVVNPPSQYPPDDIQTILEGYTETLSSDEWSVKANLSPYKPNHVRVMAETAGDTNAQLGRRSGDANTATRSALTTSSTSIPFDPNRHRWTTRSVWDACERTSSNGYGTADSGQPWSTTGGSASDHSVSTGQMRQLHSTANVLKGAVIDSANTDWDVGADLSWPVNSATTATLTRWICGRYTDASNYYVCRLDLNTAGAVVMLLGQRVAGSLTTLVASTTVDASYTANTAYRVRFAGRTETDGRIVLSARAWIPAIEDDPAEWFLTYTDTTPDLTSGTNVALLSRAEAGNTNVPLTMSWDNVGVSDSFGDPDDFPLDVRLAGELVTASKILTTRATYIAVGAASHADNSAVSPALYAGGAADDWICVLGRIRGTAGSLATPTGYDLVKQVGNLYLWAKVHSGSESAPAVTPSGGSAGDTVSAFTFGLRGMPTTLSDLADAVITVDTRPNASAANIAYGRVYPQQRGSVLLLLAGKSDDWTSVAQPSGWTEFADLSTTTGSDQGLYGAYQIQVSPTFVPEGSLVVTGGASAVSESMVLVLAGGYQTMTVTRNVNGIVGGKAHSAGVKLEVEDAIIRAM